MLATWGNFWTIDANGNQQVGLLSRNAQMNLCAGEWWNSDPDDVEKEMMRAGDGPNSSLAYTINGLPGPLYPCSNKGTLYLYLQFFVE